MRPPPPNHGHFSSEQEASRLLFNVWWTPSTPLCIYLFGNRAERARSPRQRFRPAGGFDDEAPNANADYDEVYAPLLGMGIGCDVIPCLESELLDVMEDQGDAPVGFAGIGTSC